MISYFIDSFGYLLSSGLFDGFLSFIAISLAFIIAKSIFLRRSFEA